MFTVSVTFVQATFDVATFVHINNISAVTPPILSNFSRFLGNDFAPTFFLTKICLDLTSFSAQNFVRPKYFLDPTLFLDTKFLGQYIFWTKFFWTKNFIGHKTFLDPKLFRTQNFFGPKTFLNSKLFWTQNFFGPKYFATQHFFGP